MTRPTKRVAIIGAGPTGLAQLKSILDTRKLEHRAYELEVVVYESKPDVGGVWYSTEEPKSYKRAVIRSGDEEGKGKEKERMYIYPPDLPGQEDPSPMYEGLRTNLPKELMAFRDFPFPDDTPLFPDRRMIHQYFRDYATHSSLWPYIRFNTRVDRLYRPEGGEESGQWIIESWTSNPDLDGKKREEFDFVCVGNGHYQDGWIPDIPGLSTFPGEILHSIYYLRPEDYISRSILVVGSFASGSDLARQLASLNIGRYDKQGNRLPVPRTDESDTPQNGEEGFTKVYVSCSNPPETNDPWTPYITYLPLISHLDQGDIHFQSPSSSSTSSKVLRKGEIDTIIFATGYNFSLPFCKVSDSPWNKRRILQEVIQEEERQGGREGEVGGMKGLTMEGLDPLMLFLEGEGDGERSIAFPILQYQIVPFPLAETQTRLTALLWSGAIHLPDPSVLKTEIPRNHSNPFSNPSPDKGDKEPTETKTQTRKVVQMRRQLVFGSPYEFEYQEYLMSLMAGATLGEGDDPGWVQRWWAAQGIKKRWRADTTLRKRTLGY